MKFCQIQLNYLDRELQRAREKRELPEQHNIPVWVMKPLHGGRLASFSGKDTGRSFALNPRLTTPVE